MQLMAKIIVRYQNQILGEHSLKPGFTTIGRLPTNPICIENLGISRNHAFILGDIGRKLFILEDLQSLNGSYVNKKRVHKCLLKHNDVITIGQHALEFLEEAVAVAVPTPVVPSGFAASLVDEAGGKVLPLAKDINYIGNSSADDIHVPGIMVGRQFASIDRKGTAWVVNQLVKRFSSLKVNGEEVNSAFLKDGDMLEAGGMKFIFRLAGG